MIKVLIVDDSALFSSLLRTRLSEYPDIEIVGTAGDPYEARDKILELDPDVMTLDIEMPRMDGLKFIKKLLPQYRIPVIMISSLAVKEEEAIRSGAVNFHVKPSTNDPDEVNTFISSLAGEIRRLCPSKSRVAAKSTVQHSTVSHTGSSGVYSRNGIEIIALGASTGGTDALEKVVTGLPDTCPPVVITQHMPPVFTGMYAQRLNKSSKLAVFEARDGMRLEKGMCVIAEGGKHMELHRDSSGYYITSREGEKVSGHCPSVDVMFHSVASAAGKAVVAALLTGMGADGAKGMLEMRKAGAYTIGQNKETCVVYGMPMEAYKMGAVCEEAALDDISGIILRKMLM